MKQRSFILALLHLTFLSLPTHFAVAHPQSFRDEMSKYNIVFEKAKSEILVMKKNELDAFRNYLSTCHAGKNWPIDSLPFFHCLKAEMDYVIEFARQDRTLEQVMNMLGEDRHKASSEEDKMRSTLVHQIEGYLENWVRERYQQLRKEN